ncbi:cyclase [Mycobacterium asiaticum]|uniref:Cyclase n=1 Tax=Mycobacterium asiaticum TaxID=1790 RepID=A0A1A3NTJ5_MYCAS|nr:SRPBCC family protein [Mycobacterium asiaticum]OBK23642.1 cyclase [Mycobacterium asiaticum]
MAINEFREVVITATPAEVMSVLMDLESLPQWSALHDKVEILERDEQGRPSKSRQTVKVIGFRDEQLIDYSFQDDSVSWTLLSAKQLRAQQVRYTLTREGDSTRLRLELEVELAAPVPGVFVRKATSWLIQAATEGVRKRVLEVS